MPAPYHTLPIVGAFYRPPAQILLNSLAVDTPLFLCAEPDNPADPNAVAVWIVSSDIPASAHFKLEVELPNCGLTLDQVLETEQWHLGYVPAIIAKELRRQEVIKENEVLPVTFCLDDKSKPRVRFAEPVL